MRDLLTGSAGREKAEGWLPNYMALTFKSYTRTGCDRNEYATSKVKCLIKSA